MKLISLPLTTPKCQGTIRALLFTGLLLFASLPVFAQKTPALPAPGEQAKTLWQQIREGGWVMFPIALC